MLPGLRLIAASFLCGFVAVFAGLRMVTSLHNAHEALPIMAAHAATVVPGGAAEARRAPITVPVLYDLRFVSSAPSTLAQPASLIQPAPPIAEIERTATAAVIATPATIAPIVATPAVVAPAAKPAPAPQITEPTDSTAASDAAVPQPVAEPDPKPVVALAAPSDEPPATNDIALPSAPLVTEGPVPAASPRTAAIAPEEALPETPPAAAVEPKHSEAAPAAAPRRHKARRAARHRGAIAKAAKPAPAAKPVAGAVKPVAGAAKPVVKVAKRRARLVRRVAGGSVDPFGPSGTNYSTNYSSFGSR